MAKKKKAQKGKNLVSRAESRTFNAFTFNVSCQTLSSKTARYSREVAAKRKIKSLFWIVLGVCSLQIDDDDDDFISHRRRVSHEQKIAAQKKVPSFCLAACEIISTERHSFVPFERSSRDFFPVPKGCMHCSDCWWPRRVVWLNDKQISKAFVFRRVPELISFNHFVIVCHPPPPFYKYHGERIHKLLLSYCRQGSESRPEKRANAKVKREENSEIE